MSVETVDTLVVGAGQAGVAMSEHLSTCGVPHLVVERHRIAERWRSERWDSLVANGPAWHDRFPGMEFPDTHADAFVHKEKVADYFVAYAESNFRSRPLWRGSKGSPQGCRSSRVSPKNIGRSYRGQQRGRSHRGFSAPDDASACSWKRRAHADPLQLLQESGSVAERCSTGGRCRILWGADRGRTLAFGQARLPVGRAPRSSAALISPA